MTSEEAIKALLEILEAHGSRSDTFEKELNDIHLEWQRDRGWQIRLEAQVKSLVSVLGELASQSGVSPAHVAACFRERFVYFQDQHLQKTEATSPDLAAHIDTRVPGEIPTEQGFRPLFSDSH
jgi:chemotaxis regulatin CheY-phosphate phosphatase CheZ